MIVKLGGKLKAWLAESAEIARVNKHLPEKIRARRGSRPGHVSISASGLSYQFDRSRFGSAQELADYAASKIPNP